MTQYVYLVCLGFAITGLLALDWRHKLAFWYDKRRTLKTMCVMLAIFIAWDALGIGLGIFLHGNGPYSLPLRLAPEFPLEEILFLFLLCYTTLVLLRITERLWHDTSS